MPFQCPRCHAEIDRNFKACPHCGEPITDFQRRYADEPIDGKYRIVERLGMGGMGEVYKVEHTYLGTTRVVKVIRPQIADSGGEFGEHGGDLAAFGRQAFAFGDQFLL